MHLSRLTAATTIAAALAGATAAQAGTPFSGNVCGMLSAKQATAIPGVTSKCTNAKPSKGPGSTIYVGNWAGKTSRSSSVQVTISLYTDSGALALAKRNLGQGLPGAPKKVTGIGSAAFIGTGAGSGGIHFNVGKYVAYVTVTNIKASAASGSLVPLAKAIAARL